MRHLFAVLALAALLVAPAAHARQLAKPIPIPGLQAGQPSGLKLRIVKYQGDTNGSMLVDVVNDEPVPQPFVATGLYFVPKGDPETSPQRLGAAGPFDVVGAKGASPKDQLIVAPGATVRLELQVFCIVTPRRSPCPGPPVVCFNHRGGVWAGAAP